MQTIMMTENNSNVLNCDYPKSVVLEYSVKPSKSAFAWFDKKYSRTTDLG